MHIYVAESIQTKRIKCSGYHVRLVSGETLVRFGLGQHVFLSFVCWVYLILDNVCCVTLTPKWNVEKKKTH